MQTLVIIIGNWIINYLTFACHFGRYRYVRLQFRTAPASDIFQRKTDEIIKEVSNVFGITDTTLVVGYDNDSEGHNRRIMAALKIYRK